MDSARPALFLDRDGVINIDKGYVYRREDIIFVDGIFELCRAALRHGYSIIIITNQAGIGRGYYSEADFATLTEWMIGKFAEQDVEIAAVYYCPHHPVHGIGPYKTDSPFRKPRPGMILQAAKEHCIDLARSMLVGDKISDIEAGSAAGVGRLVLYHESSENEPSRFQIRRISNLLEAASILVGG
ncbi:MAG: D-glycero-alpha-D-manno-heptose-1,7-bisphosphate 7-phosphatase [Synechococcaceae cyanobacterium]